MRTTNNGMLTVKLSEGTFSQFEALREGAKGYTEIIEAAVAMLYDANSAEQLILTQVRISEMVRMGVSTEDPMWRYYYGRSEMLSLLCEKLGLVDEHEKAIDEAHRRMGNEKRSL